MFIYAYGYIRCLYLIIWQLVPLIKFISYYLLERLEDSEEICSWGCYDFCLSLPDAVPTAAKKLKSFSVFEHKHEGKDSWCIDQKKWIYETQHLKF